MPIVKNKINLEKKTPFCTVNKYRTAKKQTISACFNVLQTLDNVLFLIHPLMYQKSVKPLNQLILL